MFEVIRQNRSLRTHLRVLGEAFSLSKVYAPKHLTKFVLLCGANKGAPHPQGPSARRQALLDFAHSNLKHTQFFLAEEVFDALQQDRKKKNVLDIENTISKFSDHILIVLESASTFAELGAFSSQELRSKLIVVNDKKYTNSPSFITQGPLRAMEEVSGKDRILYYKMKHDGIYLTDSIGEIYAPLFELLKKPLQGRASRVSLEGCNPAIQFTKTSVMMMHDLVYFSGPIALKELAEVLNILFGKMDFMIQEHLALLVAIKSLDKTSMTSETDWFYKSTMGETYFDYKYDIHSLISVYRNQLLKRVPERFHGH